jgi:hypothetical protein
MDNVKIKGHKGTWYSIDSKVYDGKELFLMEHEQYGDEAPCIIIGADLSLVAQDIDNGFDDYDYCLEEGINPLTHEML